MMIESNGQKTNNPCDFLICEILAKIAAPFWQLDHYNSTKNKFL